MAVLRKLRPTISLNFPHRHSDMRHLLMIDRLSTKIFEKLYPIGIKLLHFCFMYEYSNPRSFSPSKDDGCFLSLYSSATWYSNYDWKCFLSIRARLKFRFAKHVLLEFSHVVQVWMQLLSLALLVTEYEWSLYLNSMTDCKMPIECDRC